jgi:hypothetical protein
MDRANARAVSNVAVIKRWAVLPRCSDGCGRPRYSLEMFKLQTLTFSEFSVDGGELGPSLKLKRFHVAAMYRYLAPQTVYNAYYGNIHCILYSCIVWQYTLMSHTGTRSSRCMPRRPYEEDAPSGQWLLLSYILVSNMCPTILYYVNLLKY